MKTNELQQLTSILGTDSLLADTTAAGTGRLTMAQAAAFFGTELIKPSNPVGASLSQKTPILQEVPVIELTPSDMVDGVIKSGSIKLSKIGNMVCATIYVKPQNQFDDQEGTIFAVLPEGYRPHIPTQVPMSCLNRGLLTLHITVSGECAVYPMPNASNEDSWCAAVITYFA